MLEENREDSIFMTATIMNMVSPSIEAHWDIHSRVNMEHRGKLKDLQWDLDMQGLVTNSKVLPLAQIWLLMVTLESLETCSM